MTTKTTHVIQAKDKSGWVVKKFGVKSTGVFSSQKAATDEAKRIAKGMKAGQVVIHTRSGRIVSAEMHGLPKVQKPVIKSKIGSKAIEKAVSKVVRERLASA